MASNAMERRRQRSMRDGWRQSPQGAAQCASRQSARSHSLSTPGPHSPFLDQARATPKSAPLAPAARPALPAMALKVEVKWGKEVFKDVEVDTAQPVAVFKTQLFSLTGVPPERQKIMGVKGGLLKDDAEWGKLGLKAGQKLSLLGTADKVPEAPAQQQTFMEDLPEEEQDTSGAHQPRAARRRQLWRGRAERRGGWRRLQRRRRSCTHLPACLQA